MEKIILTDPFTGENFQATKYDDFTFVAVHPLTGEQIRIAYDDVCNCFMLPVCAFDKMETLSFTDAASEMGVSVQRVSAACKSGKIPFKTLPSGSKVILRNDLLQYVENRKNGRPRKC